MVSRLNGVPHWHHLTFSLAKPIHKKEGDRLDMFQFAIAFST